MQAPEQFLASRERHILLTNVAKHRGRMLPANGEEMASMAISWDGTILAAGGEHSYQVRFWQIQSGHELAPPLSTPPMGATVSEFSPDGKTLITWNARGFLGAKPFSRWLSSSPFNES